MRFQSSFMLTTIQPCFIAMSYISWLKVPTEELGFRPSAALNRMSDIPHPDPGADQQKPTRPCRDSS